MSQDEYFKFVQTLAADLNREDIKLPSFPDVVMQIRSALDDPDTTSHRLAEIIGNDAMLASRILIFANSAYYNPAGFKIQGLDAAVGRIGFERVRTAAITYAVEQLHGSEDLAPLKDDLRAIWSEGLCIAALSEVTARHCTELDADSAFVAGLLNRIGVLYIFTKYSEYPSLLQDPEARQSLIDDWAAPIGESIVANWGFSEDIQASLNPDEVETTRRRVKPNYADVVTTARFHVYGGEGEMMEMAEAKRIGLTDEAMPAILASYEQKLDSLGAAVG